MARPRVSHGPIHLKQRLFEHGPNLDRIAPSLCMFDGNASAALSGRSEGLSSRSGSDVQGCQGCKLRSLSDPFRKSVEDQDSAGQAAAFQVLAVSFPADRRAELSGGGLPKQYTRTTKKDNPAQNQSLHKSFNTHRSLRVRATVRQNLLLLLKAKSLLFQHQR